MLAFTVSSKTADGNGRTFDESVDSHEVVSRILIYRLRIKIALAKMRFSVIYAPQLAFYVAR